MRIAAAVALNSEQRQALERMARARSMPARLVERARIVLFLSRELLAFCLGEILSTIPLAVGFILLLACHGST